MLPARAQAHVFFQRSLVATNNVGQGAVAIAIGGGGSSSSSSSSTTTTTTTTTTPPDRSSMGLNITGVFVPTCTMVVPRYTCCTHVHVRTRVRTKYVLLGEYLGMAIRGGTSTPAYQGKRRWSRRFFREKLYILRLFFFFRAKNIGKAEVGEFFDFRA
jgi:hypothetical protein